MHRLIIQFLINYPEKPVEKKEVPPNSKFSKAEINDYIDELVKEISGANSEFSSGNEKPSEEITAKVDSELPGNISFIYTDGIISLAFADFTT